MLWTYPVQEASIFPELAKTKVSKSSADQDRKVIDLVLKLLSWLLLHFRLKAYPVQKYNTKFMVNLFLKKLRRLQPVQIMPEGHYPVKRV